MSRCCDLADLGFIEVEGRRVGIVGLRAAITEAAELGLVDPQGVGEALLARVEEGNWIPPERRRAYADALRAAYDEVTHG